MLRQSRRPRAFDGLPPGGPLRRTQRRGARSRLRRGCACRCRHGGGGVRRQAPRSRTRDRDGALELRRHSRFDAPRSRSGRRLHRGVTVNSSVAKEVFEQIFLNDIEPDVYVEEHGLKTVNDADALRTTLEKVIADNPQAVADYRGGKEKALGALVGQTMKAMKGKANPGMVNKMLREMLG